MIAPTPDLARGPFHVLIIGGGIAGPALALFLRKAGISCAVYEAYPQGTGVGGGFNLAPNGMNVLASLGLAGKVRSLGAPAEENCFRSESGWVMARMKNGRANYGQGSVSLLRADLHELLAREMHDQGISVEYGKRLAALRQSDTKVIAQLDDGTSAEGDLLIGADGIHSQTRKCVFTEGPAPASVGIIGVGGVVPGRAVPAVSRRDKQSLNFTFGGRGFFGYCGSRGEDVIWWTTLPRELAGGLNEPARLSTESLKKQMLARFQGYHEPVEALITHSGPILQLDIYDIQSLPTWCKNRVLLIGDAAHAVSPNAGQGASMALEDAVYLAKLLRGNPQDWARSFAQFERDRKPRAERIVAEGRRRSSDKRIVSPVKSIARNLFLALMLRLLGNRGLDWLYSYKVDWDEPVATV
jgi:2-polyprenyl-6-methoxyphenol hydroxylase-like FAD-dependent oxidoreductase